MNTKQCICGSNLKENYCLNCGAEFKPNIKKRYLSLLELYKSLVTAMDELFDYDWDNNKFKATNAWHELCELYAIHNESSWPRPRKLEYPRKRIKIPRSGNHWDTKAGYDWIYYSDSDSD